MDKETLSDKRIWKGKQEYIYLEEDVKEAIKKLRGKLLNEFQDDVLFVCEKFMDEIFGEELTNG